MLKNIQKSLYLAAIIGVIVGTNITVQKIGDWHYNTVQNGTLFDLCHLYLPDIHQYQWLIQIIPVALFTFAFMQWNGLTILREFFWMFLLLMVIRTLTIIGTILPKHETCITDTNAESSWFFVINGGCYDKIFSAHTSAVVLLGLLLVKYKDIGWPMFWFIGLSQGALILLTRAHYTVDVVLAFIISYLIYDGDYKGFIKYFKGIGK